MNLEWPSNKKFNLKKSNMCIIFPINKAVSLPLRFTRGVSSVSTAMTLLYKARPSKLFADPLYFL